MNTDPGSPPHAGKPTPATGQHSAGPTYPNGQNARSTGLTHMARERSDENTNLIHPQAAGMAPDVTHVRPVGGPVGLAWREGTLTRACELEALCAWIRLKNPRYSDRALTTSIHYHLEAARDAALGKKPDPKWLRIFRNGPLIERAMSNLDAAEAQLLNLAPARYILGQMPCLVRHVQCHLPSTD